MVDGCTTGWIWASAASERSDTTPTSSSPSTIGRCRYDLSERSAKASCTERVGAAQSGASVIHSLTLVSSGAAPVALKRTRSRSVRMQIGTLPSTHDRTSAVEGTMVSGGVDVGGGRII